MNITWQHGELAGPSWDARVEPPTPQPGVYDYFMLNVWNFVSLAHARFEWAWEVVYHEDEQATPQVMGSGIAKDVVHARVAAMIGLSDVLAQSGQIDYRPDAKPLDRVR